MAQTVHYVASDGTDTYANALSSLTPCSLTTAFGGAIAGDTVKLKAGTYSRVAADTPTNSGTAAAPIIYEGCDASWASIVPSRTNLNGPLVTTGLPLLAYTAGNNLVCSSKAYTILYNLNFTGAMTNGLVKTGNSNAVASCAVANSGTGNGCAATMDGTHGLIFDCDMTQSAAGLAGIYIGGSSATSRIIGGRITATGVPCIDQDGSATVVVQTILNGGTYGVKMATLASLTMVNVTGYGFSSDGLLLPNSASAIIMPVLINCHFTDIAGRFCNSAYSGTANLPIFRAYNRTRDNVSADAGFGDWPDLSGVTTDAGNNTTDYVNAGGGDFRLISTAAGFRGSVLKQDIGASQHAEPTLPAAGDVKLASGTYGYADALVTPTGANISSGGGGSMHLGL